MNDICIYIITHVKCSDETTCLCAFQDLKIFFDGAARHNSIPSLRRSSFGVVYYVHDILRSYDLGCLDSVSNNEAEFSALVTALHRISSLRVSSVQFFGDSSLVIDTFNGALTLRAAHLEQLYALGISFMAFMPSTSFSFHHVPRMYNRVADYLANMALDLVISPSLDLGNPFNIVDSTLSALSPLSSYMDSSYANDWHDYKLLDVFSGKVDVVPDQVRIRDPSSFQAGSLHNYLDFWSSFVTDSQEGSLVRKWLSYGVDITEFFSIIRGNLIIYLMILMFLLVQNFQIMLLILVWKIGQLLNLQRKFLLEQYLFGVKLGRLILHIW